MRMRRRYWLPGAALALGAALTLNAADDSGDVKPDVPAPAPAALFHEPVRLAAAGQPIDHGPAWGHTSPWLADVDGDGARDLVVGDFSGFFTVYRNTGTDAKPEYAKGTRLQAGGKDAQVPIY